MKSVDAPWLYFYADQSGAPQVAKRAIPRTFSQEKALTKSSFKVDFTTTPDIYRPAINAAVDVWAENFASQVPVKVQILWERQANAGPLAAASPGKLQSNFKNIPDKLNFKL